MEKENDIVMEEELQHLTIVQKVIKKQLETLEENISENLADIMAQKKYMWENIYELDPEEIASNRVLISDDQSSYERKVKRKRSLLKLYDNTYFSRIDFAFDGEDETEKIYIGLGSLLDEDTFELYVYDWRTPVASMYYDFEIGNAFYESPSGRISGKIIEKRQLKIRNGMLEYALLSDHNIDDEVLQKELAKSGSIKMRNIVSTIQKEQNSIIRDSDSNILIVQGVAGSGKTSIALHRVAYLLYKYRNNLSSSEVLIISPNSIFAEYISNVLPELGEENISEVSFDIIAENEIGKICNFEKKYEHANYIINCSDEKDERLDSIRTKKGALFLTALQKYIGRLYSELIDFKDLSIFDEKISAKSLKDWYERFPEKVTVFERLDSISEGIANMCSSSHDVKLGKKQLNAIKQKVYSLAKKTDLIELYGDFLNQFLCDHPQIRVLGIKGKKIPYEDVFPIVLLKILIFGKATNMYSRVKHVIVDEMQDYSMVQFEILNQCFNCKMTILGDISQVIDRTDSLLFDELKSIFKRETKFIKMMKSFRSTYEIGQLCKKIGNIEELELIERHGDLPKINLCQDYFDMIKAIEKEIEQINLEDKKTIAIICKSAEQAESFFNSLDIQYSSKCTFMNSSGDHFVEGLLVTNSFLVKGLEFDYVIIPSVTSTNYYTERDRQILYISCTRALHNLSIYSYGQFSEFIM